MIDNRTNINSLGPTINEFDYYGRGYKTGSQVSVFIGPIWVDEIVSLQKTTTSGDRPVYPYASVYHDRLLLGRYAVQGVIGIAHTEPNYLLRIINEAKSVSIQDHELYELLERRKSVFENTVKYQLLTEQVLSGKQESGISEYAHNYVKRISMEVELQTLNSEKVDPEEFEITIIKGDLYSDTQTIDIYEGVKIIGTDDSNINDDNPQVEFYRFVGRRKPPRKERYTIQRSPNRFSRTNLMDMAKNLAETLVIGVLSPPRVSVTSYKARTPLLINTDRIALAGFLNPRTRFYGKTASFCELVYILAYDRYIHEYQPYPFTVETKDMYSTDVPLQIYKPDGSLDESIPVTYLGPRKREMESEIFGFDNAYGKIVAVDRKETAKYITAIAPVKPEAITRRLGGSVAFPRYERNTFDIGSFIPPVITEMGTMNYTNGEVNNYTMTTLWNSLCNFRSVSSDRSHIGQIRTVSGTEDENTPKINEISQPVFTMAYVATVKGEYESPTLFSISISMPIYIDYLKTKITGIPESASSDRTVEEIISQVTPLTTKEEIFNIDNDVMITFTKDGETMIPTGPEDNALVADSLIGVVHASHSIPDILAAADYSPAPMFTPQFFKIEKTITSAPFATSFNKCLYIAPFIYETTPEITGLTQQEVDGAMKWVASFEETPDVPADANAGLAYWMKRRQQDGTDDSCTFDLLYDWQVENAAGFTNAHQSFSINGVYFLQYRSGITPKVRVNGGYINVRDNAINYQGTDIPLADIYNVDNLSQQLTYGTVHVYWLSAIMPLQQADEAAVETITFSHNLTDRPARYLEIYNLVRCDVLYHPTTPWYNYNPENSLLQSIYNALVRAFEGAINVFTATEYHTPVHKTMKYIAAFMRGSAFVLDVDEIVTQICDSVFVSVSLSGIINSERLWDDFHIPPPASGTQSWIEAMRIAVGPAGLTDAMIVDIKRELASEIRIMITTIANERGVRITEHGERFIYGEHESMMPAPQIICTKFDDLDQQMAMPPGSSGPFVPDGEIHFGDYTNE